MLRIAEIRVPADSFPLGRTLSLPGEVTIHLDRIVPTTEAVFPYFWVRGVDPETVRGAFQLENGLRSVTLVDEVDGRALFRATWADEADGVVGALVETGVTLLSGIGAGEEWTFELRAEPGGLSAFQQYCEAHDVPITLGRLAPLSGNWQRTDVELTDEQREALRLALQHGYYEEPRETDLAALADELGISRQAFAARLRRAYRTLAAGVAVGVDITGDKRELHG